MYQVKIYQVSSPSFFNSVVHLKFKPLKRMVFYILFCLAQIVHHMTTRKLVSR